VTKDDIIRMANESQISGLEICGDHDYDVVCTLDELELFANIVAAAEREACAKLCKESDRYRGDYFASIIKGKQ